MSFNSKLNLINQFLFKIFRIKYYFVSRKNLISILILSVTYKQDNTVLPRTLYVYSTITEKWSGRDFCFFFVLFVTHGLNDTPKSISNHACGDRRHSKSLQKRNLINSKANKDKYKWNKTRPNLFTRLNVGRRAAHCCILIKMINKCTKFRLNFPFPRAVHEKPTKSNGSNATFVPVSHT